MLKSLEKVILSGGKPGFSKNNYTDAVIVGVDFPMISRSPLYEGTNIREMLDTISEGASTESTRFFACLDDYADMHPEFLFTKAKTLNLALHQLDSKAERWNTLSEDKQIKLLEEFMAFASNY